MPSSLGKSIKNVFVIMPFTQTPSRGKAQLTSFFDNNIKKPIEGAEGLANRYVVRRSDTTLDITTQITRDVLRADIVVADLSGIQPNPNVMYELGIRLAVSSKPVILIREENPDNERVFDVSVYYVHSYDPLEYPSLEAHLIDKLRRFETGEELYESPIVRAMGGERPWHQLTSATLTPEQQRVVVLRSVKRPVDLLGSAYGPRGGRVSVAKPGAYQLMTRRATEIITGVGSTDPLEEEGIDVIRQVVRDLNERFGQAGKTAALIAGALLDEVNAAVAQGYSRDDISSGMRIGLDAARVNLGGRVIPYQSEQMSRPVTRTAARSSELADLVLQATEDAGGAELLTIESGDRDRTSILTINGHVFEGTVASRDFVEGEPDGGADLTSCRVLVAELKVQSMRELLPVLEQVASADESLVIFAETVEGEALATLLANNERGNLRSLGIRIGGVGSRRAETLKDIAILTGAKFVTPVLGETLEALRLDDLGHANSVRVLGEQVAIDVGTDSPDVARRLETLRAAMRSATNDYERSVLLQRFKALSGRGAIIDVGGLTANEIGDARYDVEAALNALVLAGRGGVIVGGGVALLAASVAVERVSISSAGKNAGKNAIAVALRSPFNQLARSCGLGGEETVDALRASLGRSGIDVRAGKIVPDLIAAGVVDPAIAVTQAVLIAYSRVRDLIETSAWSVDALFTIGG